MITEKKSRKKRSKKKDLNAESKVNIEAQQIAAEEVIKNQPKYIPIEEATPEQKAEALGHYCNDRANELEKIIQKVAAAIGLDVELDVYLKIKGPSQAK